MILLVLREISIVCQEGSGVGVAAKKVTMQKAPKVKTFGAVVWRVVAVLVIASYRIPARRNI